jgi:hypothetical protein
MVTSRMVAIVMGFIADLDSLRSGFVRVNLRRLVRLSQDLQNGQAPAPVPPPSAR